MGLKKIYCFHPILNGTHWLAPHNFEIPKFSWKYSYICSRAVGFSSKILTLSLSSYSNGVKPSELLPFLSFGERKMYVEIPSAPTPPAIHSHFEAARPVNLHCAASMRTCISPRTSNRGHGIAIFRSAAMAPRCSPAPLWGNATCRTSRSQETTAHENQPPTPSRFHCLLRTRGGARGGGYGRAKLFLHECFIPLRSPPLPENIPAKAWECVGREIEFVKR